MIHVIRTPVPPILLRNANRWLTIYLDSITTYNINPSSINKKNKTNAEKKYNHYLVKKALKDTFSGKCAYCESHLSHIDYGHIEHYKPKSLYPRECFKWENLLLACSVCNGSEFKGNHFPLAAQNGPLINPTVENPEDFFCFEFDVVTGTANVIEKHPRGQTTKTLLGLNRPELVRHRSGIVRKMALIAIQANSGDALALIEIRKCRNSDEEYSAFAIEICRHFNIF